jgi:RNA recognition motif-containing protein
MAKPSDPPSAQIHVSFLSKQVDVLITETTLRSLFSRFGEVVDVAIKKIQFNPVRPFGFLLFIISYLLLFSVFAFRMDMDLFTFL